MFNTFLPHGFIKGIVLITRLPLLGNSVVHRCKKWYSQGVWRTIGAKIQLLNLMF